MSTFTRSHDPPGTSAAPGELDAGWTKPGPGTRVQGPVSVCQAVFPQYTLPRLQLSRTDGSDEINNRRGQLLQQAHDEWVWFQ